MPTLMSGVLLFAGVHLFPSVAAPTRARLIARIGQSAYNGGFALSVSIAIGLIVLGWRHSDVVAVYAPPAWGRLAVNLAMPIALLFFLASRVPTNLERLVRHPQLTGVACWSLAHLLANGDSRALVLFGGLAVWSIGEMVLIDRREGAWSRPAPVPWVADLKPLVAAAVAFFVLRWAHPWFTGASALPG